MPNILGYKTGDQLVTRGRSWFSGVIAAWTDLISDIRGGDRTLSVSHTAIVVVEPGRLPRVYECNSSCSIPDAEDGRLRKGVTCHELDRYLELYNGEIWHVPLKEPLRNPIAAIGYWKRRHADQVNYDLRGAIRAATPGWSEPVIDTETNAPLYCTAYWAYGVSRYGRAVGWPADTNPHELHPKEAMRLPCMAYDDRRQLK